MVLMLITDKNNKKNLVSITQGAIFCTTHLLQGCYVNNKISSGVKLILFRIFGVVTTHPLQECCVDYIVSSGGMLILFCTFGVVTTHLLQECYANNKISSGGN